ncbi:MAG TPA: helix-turn-helix domain-containing protein [Solirubrobacteraceae bacterium]|nr:helix-turn-helix domain-containing protein [Solirubrobacteraceae bacterium]
MQPDLASNQLEAPQGRVERRKARTRATLLAAARHLFATQGFEQTTIRDIAAQADIALGGFYNYFRTKDDVLSALLGQALVQQLRLLTFRQEQVDDVAERVSIAHRHLLAAARQDPDWGWLLVRMDVDHHVIDSVLGERAGEDLHEGLHAGRFDVANPELALRASGGALLAVVQDVLRGVFSPDDDCAHAEGVLRAFGVPAKEAAKIARRPLPALPEEDR